MKNRFVIIIGAKHSGKSSVARAIERTNDVPAVDLDELIEKQSGKTPRELFIKGPEIFRKAEAEALASLLCPAAIEFEVVEQLVIAAGGGLAENEEAMTLLSKAKDICFVYLKMAVFLLKNVHLFLWLKQF